MMQILSYNEEYLDLCAVCAVPDESSQEDFRRFVKERAAQLLGVSEEEAERLMEDEAEEEVSYSAWEDGAGAAIRFGGEYEERLCLTDIPSLPGKA